MKINLTAAAVRAVFAKLLVVAAVFILWELAWYVNTTGVAGLWNCVEHIGWWETLQSFFTPQKS